MNPGTTAALDSSRPPRERGRGPHLPSGRGGDRELDRRRLPRRGEPGPLVQRAGRFPPDQPRHGRQGPEPAGRRRVLYKRRGVGMFVPTGAREQLLKRRRSEFADQYVRPLMTEADKLGISARELNAMIEDWKGRR